MNYPNPFVDQTNFVFKHNKSGSVLDIEINIYDLNGRFVSQLSKQVTASGVNGTSVSWDGTDQYGDQLESGLYTYQLIVTDYYGNSSIQTQKLIKLTH